MRVFAEKFVGKCVDKSKHIHVFTSGHRRTGNTFDWVFNYKTACLTNATMKYRMAYTNWRKNEPKNFRDRGEDCVQATLTYVYAWNDAPCDDMHCFVCENRGAS